MPDRLDNVVPLRQSAKNIARLEKLVHELARDSTQVRIEVPQLGQGELEDIDLLDVFRILRNGRLQSAIERGEKDGRLICRVTDTLKSVGEVTAVTEVLYRQWLLVTAVERVKK